MRLRPWVLLTPLVLALSLMACDGGDEGGGKAGRGGGKAGGGPQAEAPAEAISVRVTPLEIGPIAETYTTSTTLRAEQRATVTARTSGVIERILVEEGDKVQAGATLARLESGAQSIALQRARVTLAARDGEFRRLSDLHKKGLSSEVEYESAEASFKDAEQALALSELELAYTTIRAPFGGVVLRRLLDVGASISPGEALFEVADVNPLFADVKVPERHVQSLEVGQAVRLSVDSSRETIDGRIERIAPFVDPATGTVKVTISADPTDRGLRPGAFVRVKIVTSTREAARTVPRLALVSEGRRWMVFEVPPGEDVARKIEVRLGFEEGDRVEILPADPDAPPFEGGRAIVSSGAAALSDGARVKILTAQPGETGAEDAPAADAAAQGEGTQNVTP